MIKRLWMLLSLLLCGMGVVFVLPKAPLQPEPGVATVLPDFVGEWYGKEGVVSDKEIRALGKETRFTRKLYTNARGDKVYVSIVFSGEDMSASIHRPERCLPAQGLTMLDTSTRKVALDSASPLTVTRLHNFHAIPTRDGKPFKVYNLLYYWFVGSSETTADHTVRYFMDTRDRLLKGNTQSWAYISVLAQITDNYEKFGRTEAETDAMIEKFIRELVPLIQKPGVKIR